jgi:predicted CXXCH cytochrome family protein
MRAQLLAATFAAAVLTVAGTAAPEEEVAGEACRLRWAIRERSDGSSCRDCHSLPDTPAGRIMRRHAGGEHNSGVLYEEAVGRGALHLRPVRELPAEIVLVGGRVTCTTCHDPASRARQKTAMPGGVLDLCTACHQL